MWLKRILTLWALAVGLVAVVACGGQSDSGDGDAASGGKGVFFIEPTDGAQVVSPLWVRMGANGLVVRNGYSVKEGYGHHHLFISDETLTAPGEKIPSDATHVHYHSSESEAIIDLSRGRHTLTLLFGNDIDQPHQPLYTETITIDVIDSKRVFFEAPENGADIREFPFEVAMGSEGLEDEEGHFVVIYDIFPLLDLGKPFPEDEYHIHLPPGETRTEMDIRVGSRPIWVFFVDENNMPRDPPVFDEIEITVWRPIEESP